MKPSSIRRGSFIMALALAVAFVLAGAGPGAAQVPDPTPLNLGALPGQLYSQANALNASGQVVGTSYTTDLFVDGLPFLWQKGVMIQLPLPGGFTRGGAMSINDAGQVAGYCGDVSTFRACVWTFNRRKGWGVTPLDIPANACPPGETCIGSVATKINGAGQVLVATMSESGGCYAYIWKGGVPTVLAVAVWDSVAVPLSLGRVPSKMNEKGQVLLEADNINEDGLVDLWLWDTGPEAEFLVEQFDWANLNNAGQIVGKRHIIAGPNMSGGSENFTYDTSTKKLTPSKASDAGYALVNINDAGLVLTTALTGYPTTLGLTSFADWTPTAFSAPLVSVPGSVDPATLNLNARGGVSGLSNTAGAFFASNEAGLVLLNGLDTGTVPSNVGLVPAMNDSGVVVGQQIGHDIETGTRVDTAVLWSPLPSGGLTLGTATASVKGKTVTLVLPVTNGNPTETAASVTIDTAALDGGTLTTVLPLAVKPIAPGATVLVTLKFSATSLSEQPWALAVTGTSTLGSFAGSQMVTVK